MASASMPPSNASERPQSFATAFTIARPGSMVGFVGVPRGVEVPLDAMFAGNIGLRGGSAPVRTYLPELLEDVLACYIDPGRPSTWIPTSTASRRRTPPWTNAARSSRWCGLAQSKRREADERVDERRAQQDRGSR